MKNLTSVILFFLLHPFAFSQEKDFLDLGLVSPYPVQSKCYSEYGINNILEDVQARFYQITDSISSPFFCKENFDFLVKKNSRQWLYKGFLENNYTSNNQLILFYTIFPYNSQTNSRYDKNKQGEYYYTKAIQSFYSKQSHDIYTTTHLDETNKTLNKNILNCDSIVFFTYIDKINKGYSSSLRKGYIIYRKDIGHIIITVGSTSENKDKPLDQVNALLNNLLKETWGIFRFNYSNPVTK